MNCNKNLFVLVLILSLTTSCSYTFLVRKDRVLKSTPAYLVTTPEQTILFPVLVLQDAISPEILKDMVGYRIYSGCNLNHVIKQGRSFTVTELYQSGKNDTIREEKLMTISKCIVVYHEKSNKDTWDKALIEFEYNDTNISYNAFALFKGEILNLIDRN